MKVIKGGNENMLKKYIKKELVEFEFFKKQETHILRCKMQSLKINVLKNRLNAD